MNKDLTISELFAAKAAAEIKMTKVLDDFMSDFGITDLDVDVNFRHFPIVDGEIVSANVKIKINI